jgi:hypothetical protein
MNPQDLRRTEGVDRIPMPADRGAMQASIKRHWPTTPGAVGASVTVDVTVDETGRVTAVRPFTPSVEGDIPTRIVLRERNGSERLREIRRDPNVAPAAEAALREVQFTPALRDGQAVPHTFRMTVTFTPDDRGSR